MNGSTDREGASEDPDLEWPRGFARSVDDRRALAVLLGLSIGPRALLILARTHPTARACLRAIHLGRAGSPADRERAAAADPLDVWRAVERCGATLVGAGEPGYPPSLLHLDHPPPGLFVRGTLQVDLDRTVAVVGARNCSAAGREMARAIGRGLAAAGVCVVSGAARGIDAAAHQGALDAEGPTVAVLGCGIDIAYPRENRDLISRIQASGALVSEYAPGVPAEPFRFPARNRIVAGLARAVVVVEGASGSGARITVDEALHLGREVFAVPGSPVSALAAVPLSLIREGARMIRGPADLLEDLQIAPAPASSSHAGDAPRGTTSISERKVLDALGGLCTPDEVAAGAGVLLPEAIAVLVGLELRGLVRSTGGRFERTYGAVP